MVAAAIFGLQTLVFAGELKGKISGIDAVTQHVKVAHKDEAGKEVESAIAVTAKTTFAGVKGFAELAKDAMVNVETAKNAQTGALEAVKIEVTK